MKFLAWKTEADEFGKFLMYNIGVILFAIFYMCICVFKIELAKAFV